MKELGQQVKKKVNKSKHDITHPDWMCAGIKPETLVADQKVKFVSLNGPIN